MDRNNQRKREVRRAQLQRQKEDTAGMSSRQIVTSVRMLQLNLVAESDGLNDRDILDDEDCTLRCAHCCENLFRDRYEYLCETSQANIVHSLGELRWIQCLGCGSGGYHCQHSFPRYPISCLRASRRLFHIRAVKKRAKTQKPVSRGSFVRNGFATDSIKF
jgi:hypothetical protein